MADRREGDLAAMGKCLSALAQRVTAIETCLDNLRAELDAIGDSVTKLQAKLRGDWQSE